MAAKVMITPTYVVLMARYNHWQNENLLAAAETLTPARREEDRGAFFGSILGTLSHVLWGDAAWMSRFEGGPPPRGDLQNSATAFPDWPNYVADRRAMDRRIADWAAALSEADLDGDLEWYSAAARRHMKIAKATAVIHLFNHATHHRGQVHALLTAAGATPGDTDLPFLPTASA